MVVCLMGGYVPLEKCLSLPRGTKDTCTVGNRQSISGSLLVFP